MPFLWGDAAWEDYTYWADQDKKTFRKINALLKSIGRDGKPMGKAEMLKGDKHGLSSVRIDAKNRLVYSLDGDVVRVVSCKGHYNDK